MLLLLGSLYVVIILVLFVFGVNFLYLTVITLKHGRKVEPTPPEPTEWPRVTVQLPIYNELYVVERLVEAVGQMEYPRHLLDVQVLDDSTDETVEITAAAVRRAQALGLNITHLHRIDRTGYKAGALAAGMASAQGEYIAIFDADFVPTPNFLLQTIPAFADEGLAFVQAKWGHLNRHYSLITSLQSLAIDAHFVVEQFARSFQRYWFNFNGTAGVWRRTAMEDAGGWKADTLTEDLDLSYRAYLKGWRGKYLKDVTVSAELPVSMGGFRKQQNRWAQGSLECAVKLLPSVWRAPVPLLTKIEATFHLLGYGVHIMLFFLMLLYPAVLILSDQYPQLVILFGFAYFFNVTAFAPTFFFIAGQHVLGRKWWQYLPRILFIMILGSGLMLNTVRAALRIVTGKKIAFERTAKFGVGQNKQVWQRKRYQLSLDPIVFFELALAFYGSVTIYYAVKMSNWAVGFYATLFTAGLFFVATLTIVQALTIYFEQRREMIRPKPPIAPKELTSLPHD